MEAFKQKPKDDKRITLYNPVLSVHNCVTILFFDLISVYSRISNIRFHFAFRDEIKLTEKDRLYCLATGI